MNLKIFKYGEPVLREKAEPVVVVTDALRKLAADMIDTMHRSKGVGLAAEQVGRTEKLCVIDIPEGCDNAEDEAFNAAVQMPLSSSTRRSSPRRAARGTRRDASASPASEDP